MGCVSQTGRHAFFDKNGYVEAPTGAPMCGNEMALKLTLKYPRPIFP